MSSSRQGYVIYIIESDTGVRESLHRLMRSAELEARPFGTVAQFLEELGVPASGCILLDITPSDADSAELQKALRSRDIELPLIALSAHHDAATRRRARALGSHFFLGKPVDDQALLDAIDWVIETG